MGPIMRLLREHTGFRWCWAEQAISSAGSPVTAVALPLVARLTLDTVH